MFRWSETWRCLHISSCLHGNLFPSGKYWEFPGIPSISRRPGKYKYFRFFAKLDFQTILSLLLKVPRMELPCSLLCWELGTNLPGQGPGEWLSPVNNSDSGAFGYFLRIINWSPVDKSAQQVNNKNSNDIINRDTMHWTSDGFTYLCHWIYSCRIAGQFTSNFRSRACLTMPSLIGITIYHHHLPKHTKAILDPWSFWPVISVPSFVVLGQIRMAFHSTPLQSLRPRLRSFGPLDFSAVFL